MADDEEFGENPFRKLDISRFVRTQEKPAIKNAPTLEERNLFLRSWEKTSAPAKKKQGFAIADLCMLPEIKKKKPAPLPRPEPKIVIPEESDEDAFQLAMRNARPLAHKGRDIAKKPMLKPAQSLRENTLDDFMAGKLEFAVSYSDEYLEGHVVGMDELIMNRLREGQFSAEANLDLHGLNAEQAFEALRVFIRNAWLKDLRCALVVTGRGRNSPDGQAILRRKIQSWLTKEPFKRVVTAFCTAKPHDGGPGSIYILLRRNRKKGRIQWERIFIDGDEI